MVPQPTRHDVYQAVLSWVLWFALIALLCALAGCGTPPRIYRYAATDKDGVRHEAEVVIPGADSQVGQVTLTLPNGLHLVVDNLTLVDRQTEAAAKFAEAATAIANAVPRAP